MPKKTQKMHIVGIRRAGGGFCIPHTKRLMRGKLAGQGQAPETYEPARGGAVEVRGAGVVRTRSLGVGLSIKPPKQKRYISL